MVSVADITYLAAGLCVVALGVFSTGLYVDEWAVSASDPRALLGVLRFCAPSAPSSQAQGRVQCSAVDWGCRVQQCDAAGGVCSSWFLFDPTGPPDASTPSFPGRGECGAFDTVRAFLLAAFLTTGLSIMVLVSASSEPCGSGTVKSSPGLLCTAGVLLCFTAILYLLSVTLFLVDVFDASTSHIGVSLILTSCSAMLVVVALFITVAAACKSVVAAEERHQTPPTIDMQDLKAYRVGNQVVLAPHTVDIDGSGSRTNDSRRARQKYEPRMRPMGTEEYSVREVAGVGGRREEQQGGGCSPVPSEMEQLPTVAQYMAELNGRWSVIGHGNAGCAQESREQSAERRVCKITRFGVVS